VAKHDLMPANMVSCQLLLDYSLAKAGLDKYSSFRAYLSRSPSVASADAATASHEGTCVA
jgi:hypothetical protein